MSPEPAASGQPQHVERGRLLLSQNRHVEAAAEFRQALLADPNSAIPHSLLAICLTQQEKYEDATREAQAGVHLAPDMALTHYVLADVYRSRIRYSEAQAAIEEALRLDPEDADYHGAAAHIAYAQKQWAAALEHAERGLQVDAENSTCVNLRAMSLVKLGRVDQANRTIASALARDPENALTHANQGWALLEQQQPEEALKHFREALRLDPEMEWAQAGIVEALQSRHLIYRWMLRYFLGMSKLSGQAQWGVILGIYFGSRYLGQVADEHPEYANWVLPLRILLGVFALMTWIARPLFNLLLRFNRFGRLALSREQIWGSNLLAVCLVPALLGLLGWALGWIDEGVWTALIFGTLSVPACAILTCSPGWPRKTMAGYTIALALLGMFKLYLIFFEKKEWWGNLDELALVNANVATLYMWGVILSLWLANGLSAVIIKR